MATIPNTDTSSSSSGAAMIWLPADKYDFKLNFPSGNNHRFIRSLDNDAFWCTHTGVEIEWGLAMGLLASGTLLLIWGVDYTSVGN
jgi:hypothetical protein